MAWRSSGTTNDEMVDNLKRFQVISSTDVENGFRNVDRKLFVPKNCKDIAHKDQPIREENIHISAPHIYGSVLEALDLKMDAGLSFCNLGSGTCYLTCIVASILGSRSVHYCVEIHKDVLRYSREAIGAWKEQLSSDNKSSNIELIHGNALKMNTNKGECALGFDRIYIGAAIEKLNLIMFKKMLKPGGILVGPVGDELIKVVRSHGLNPDSSPKYTTRVISGVRFAPLLSSPDIQTIIPARVWAPSNHHLYSNCFRGTCRELLLCSNSSRKQTIRVRPLEKVNVASMLPRALWVEVLSFTNRDWFDAPLNKVEYLRILLGEEEANVLKANQAKEESETRCRIAEKERDVYRVLARTLRTKLSSVSREENIDDIETVEETAAAMLFGGTESLSTFGLSRMLRHFRAPLREENDEEMDDDSDFDGMSEDNDGEENSSDDDSLSMASDYDDSIIEEGDNDDAIISQNRRAQARTVSLSEEDL